MNRREMLGTSVKASTALGLTGMLGITVLDSGCDKATQLEKWANVVAGEITLIQPALQSIGISGAIFTLLAQAEAVAHDLVKAIRDNEHAQILDALAALTAPDGLVKKIADEVNSLTNPTVRRIVEVALLTAHTTLVLIAANIQTVVRSSVGSVHARILAARAGKSKEAKVVEDTAQSDIVEKLFDAAFKEK